LHSPTDSAVRHHRALEGLVSLDADNLLLAPVKVSSGMGCNGGDNLGVHTQEAACRALFLRQVKNHVPQILGILCRGSQEGLVPIVGLIVLLDEVPDIYLCLPGAAHKIFPLWSHFAKNLLNHKFIPSSNSF